MDLAADAGHIVDALSTAGISAAADPRDLSVPGVLVLPHSIELQSLDGSWAVVTWDLILIAAASGMPHALNDLGDLVSQVSTAIPGVRPGSAFEARTFSDPALGGELPALTTTITTESEI